MSTAGGTLIVQFSNNNIENKQAHQEIIEAELSKHGFSGRWVVSPTKRLKRIIENGKFAVSRIEKGSGMTGLRLFSMPRGRETTWCSILVPPEKYVLEDVKATLQGKSIATVDEPEVVSDPVTLGDEGHNQWCKSTLDLRFQPGAIYWVTVEKVTSEYVQVNLFADLPGIIPMTSWSHDGVCDTCVGETVKAMLVEITDKNIVLDRVSVVNYPDTDVLTPAAEFKKFSQQTKNGTLSIRGLLEDPATAVWLLETLALEYGSLCTDFPFPATASITKVWTESLCKKFNCERIASPLSPIFRGFVSRGWIEPHGEAERGDGRPYGYALTEFGWQEANAMELGDIWLNQLQEYRDRITPADVVEEQAELVQEIAAVPDSDETGSPPEELERVRDKLVDTMAALIHEDLHIEDIPARQELEEEPVAPTADTDILVVFKEKWLRKSAIEELLKGLQEELAEINAWVANNPQVFDQYRKAEDTRKQLQAQRQSLDAELERLNKLFG